MVYPFFYCLCLTWFFARILFCTPQQYYVRCVLPAWNKFANTFQHALFSWLFLRYIILLKVPFYPRIHPSLFLSQPLRLKSFWFADIFQKNSNIHIPHPAFIGREFHALRGYTQWAPQRRRIHHQSLATWCCAISNCLSHSVGFSKTLQT